MIFEICDLFDDGGALAINSSFKRVDRLKWPKLELNFKNDLIVWYTKYVALWLNQLKNANNYFKRIFEKCDLLVDRAINPIFKRAFRRDSINWKIKFECNLDVWYLEYTTPLSDEFRIGDKYF